MSRLVSIRSSTMHGPAAVGAQKLSRGVDDEQRGPGRVAARDRFAEEPERGACPPAGASAAPGRRPRSGRRRRHPARRGFLLPGAARTRRISFARHRARCVAAVGDEPGGCVEAARPLVRLEDPQRHASGAPPPRAPRRACSSSRRPVPRPPGAGMDVERMDVPVPGALRVLAEADEPDDRAVGRLGHHGRCPRRERGPRRATPQSSRASSDSRILASTTLG